MPHRAHRDEISFDHIVSLIEEGDVIPIVGDDLVRVERDGRTLTLQQDIAERLARRLGVASDNLRPDFPLHEVVARHVERGRNTDGVYRAVKALLADEPPAAPPALAKLARIPTFKLFVSLAYDQLLADALQAQRRIERSRIHEIAYDKTALRDLKGPLDDYAGPVVFQLFGRLTNSPSCVICDDDLLEYVHALQSKGRRPERLFDELRGKHLLFLGCRFSDWLARFLIRTVKGDQLSVNRQRNEFLVERRLEDNGALVRFLQTFSYNTHILDRTGAVFVNALARAWDARPRPAAPAAPDALANFYAEKIKPGSVFISYTREDQAAHQRIRDGLAAAQIPT